MYHGVVSVYSYAGRPSGIVEAYPYDFGSGFGVGLTQGESVSFDGLHYPVTGGVRFAVTYRRVTTRGGQARSILAFTPNLRFVVGNTHYRLGLDPPAITGPVGTVSTWTEQVAWSGILNGVYVANGPDYAVSSARIERF